MKRGHVPLRTCKGCGRKAPRHELWRLSLDQGMLVAGEKGQFPGKGIYSCRETACRERLSAKIEKTRKKTHLLR